MALQQLKSASFSGYIPFSASPSGEVDFGSSNIRTGGRISANNAFIGTSGHEVQINCGEIYADGNISADGRITADSATFGDTSGNEVQISNGNVYADGNITANGASFGSCGAATINSNGDITAGGGITAKYVVGSGLQLYSPGGTLLHVTTGSGSSQYYAMIRLTSGSVVKSGYICPDSQGVLHLESSIPYTTQA